MRNLLKKGMIIIPLACIFFATAASAQMQGDPTKGAKLFEQCASCHKNIVKLSAGLAESPFVEKLKTIQKKVYEKPRAITMQKKLKAMDEQQLYDLASFITKK